MHRDGASAICNDDASAGPGGDYFLQVALGAGNDTLIQNGPIGGLFDGGDGNDHLVSAPTAAVASQLSGGTGDDAFLVGDRFGPDAVSDLSGRDFVDYRDRGPGELGGNVTVDTDGVADDGGATEGDNIGSGRRSTSIRCRACAPSAVARAGWPRGSFARGFALARSGASAAARRACARAAGRLGARDSGCVRDARAV